MHAQAVHAVSVITSTSPHSLHSCLQEWRVITQLPVNHMLEGLLHLLAAEHIRSRVQLPPLLLLLDPCAGQVLACVGCIASYTCCSVDQSERGALVLDRTASRPVVRVVC